MNDAKLLLVDALAVIGLAYCLRKTQADWHQSGFGWRVAFGTAASLSAFLFVAFLLTAGALRNL